MVAFRFVPLLALLPVAVVVANAECVSLAVMEMCQSRAGREEHQKELELARRLDILDREILRRIELKEGLVRQLVAGHLTLSDVTQRFLVLNSDRPEYMRVIRTGYPGKTDEEKTARNVISFATFQLTQCSWARRLEVLARLESEFDRLNLEGRTPTD